MMVSLIKLYVIHSGEPQQQQQLRRKYNNNEMRNELRGAIMKGQEAVERELYQWPVDGGGAVAVIVVVVVVVVGFLRESENLLF